MTRNALRPTRSSAIITVGILVVTLIFTEWPSPPPDEATWAVFSQALEARMGVSSAQKQRGAHVFGFIDSSNIQTVKPLNLEWMALVSWGFQDDYNSPDIGHHNGDSVYIRASDSNWVKQIQLVRAAGYKVFFKPHVWVNEPTEGTWRSDIFPNDETSWQSWQDSYRDFILRYARVAEKGGAEMFCIGTEFSRLTVEKPEFWENLIHEVREVYSGKITYAANWHDEYEKITFWDQLDYIGIQAYFPLTTETNPSVESIAKGWEKYLPAMEAIRKKYRRNILFTEMGYKSTANSADKPWEWIENPESSDAVFSAETQANCYRAFFKAVWNKPWFAGVYIWQVRSDFEGHNGKNDLDFTPQGKPAEAIIAREFGRR